MTKHLIIDGYNLLGVRGQVGPHSAGDIEPGREQLIRELSLYRQRKAHPITVVFDGWQQGGVSERREHRSGIQVVYSRRGERADQVIQRLAEDFGSDCAVVSSDHEVANFAKARGALVIGSPEFESKLRAGSPGRRSAGPSKRVDDDEKTLTRQRGDKKGNPKKLPKAVRRRLRQLRSF